MATELLGNTQTATYTYMTAPRLNGLATQSFLPSICSRSASSAKPYDTYPHPTPLRRSVTCMPWRSSYFGVARGDPEVPHMRSMPEPKLERSHTEFDSFKVSETIRHHCHSYLYSCYTLCRPRRPCIKTRKVKICL